MDIELLRVFLRKTWSTERPHLRPPTGSGLCWTGNRQRAGAVTVSWRRVWEVRGNTPEKGWSSLERKREKGMCDTSHKSHKKARYLECVPTCTKKKSCLYRKKTILIWQLSCYCSAYKIIVKSVYNFQNKNTSFSEAICSTNKFVVNMIYNINKYYNNIFNP